VRGRPVDLEQHWDYAPCDAVRHPQWKNNAQNYACGRRSARIAETAWGVPTATIKVKLTHQDGGVLVDATGQIELPLN
jgi:hypothetical protein